MPGRIIARFLTIAVVVGLCGFAMARGWNIVAFAAASRQAAGPAPAEPLRAWYAAPPVATLALDDALQEIAAAGDLGAAHRRVELLTRLLSLRPLSSVAWLSLAGMRTVTGAPISDMLAALKMSSITGPNEAGVMWQRGLFALLQWGALPMDFQQRAIADLAGPLAGGLVDDSDAQVARGVAEAQTPATQAQVAALLQAHGVDAAALSRIGLAADGR